jgi:hypothetical protein
VFDSLPAPIKDMAHNIKQFKVTLIDFSSHRFCTLDEYFNYRKN